MAFADLWSGRVRQGIRSAGFVAAASIAAWVLAPKAASAQSTLGMGGVSCSQYLRAARGSDILYHQASNWLLGYVSGVNSVSSGSPINLTSDQVLKAASDYCDTHPASTIANAASEWHASLPKQAAPQPRDNSFRLNLTAPERKPLLDRR